MHQLFATYLMPTTLSWEGLLLLIRRKLNTLLRYGIIKEIAIAYENLAMHFEIDDRDHDIPVCHCWCNINARLIDASIMHDKLQSLGLMMIEDECEVSDDYVEGMRNLILRWEDYDENNKYIRWKVVNHNATTQLLKVDFGLEVPWIDRYRQIKL